MTNQNEKKTNRFLLISLVAILAAATVLVALTGAANKKTASETPPLEKVEEKTADTAADGKTEEKEKNDETNSTVVKEEAKQNDGTNGTEGKNSEKAAASDAIDENEAIDAVTLDENVLPVFASPVDAPVLKSTSLAVPVFSYTMNDYRTHSGLDFAAAPGTPVMAAADGTVTEVNDDPMMGITVSLAHSGGAVTTYQGLGEDTLSLVQPGDSVRQGDVIGVAGDTALIESAEEDHVHFELSVNGEIKDPAEYLNVVFLSDLAEY